ncbi:hypothetical protein BHE74_00002788 [Ensete ventricosum]|nr:hypothetical protein GW17_00000376 [Ensete ventricosum]RWW88335.1 hypothetical protein BHE74_00002788 [Ensete ventricosum]
MKSLSWIEPQIPVVSVGSARYLRYRVGPTPSSTKSPLKTSEGKPWLQHRGVESMRVSGEDDVISTVVEGSSPVHPRSFLASPKRRQWPRDLGLSNPTPSPHPRQREGQHRAPGLSNLTPPPPRQSQGQPRDQFLVVL